MKRDGIERFLYRLTQSSYADEFILKGAVLFAIWAERPHRPTQDVDLLGSGDPSSERLTVVFRDICNTTVEPDGLVFESVTVDVQPIRKDSVYDGMRVRIVAKLGTARIALQDPGQAKTITIDKISLYLVGSPYNVFFISDDKGISLSILLMVLSIITSISENIPVMNNSCSSPFIPAGPANNSQNLALIIACLRSSSGFPSEILAMNKIRIHLRRLSRPSIVRA